MFKSITQAARHYDIAPIRVHVLLRQGLIPRHVSGRIQPEIVVASSDVEQYFVDHPVVLEEWRTNYERTRRNLELQ